MTELKVGDIVKLVDTSRIYAKRYSEIMIISRIDRDRISWPYTVVAADGLVLVCNADELVLAT